MAGSRPAARRSPGATSASASASGRDRERVGQTTPAEAPYAERTGEHRSDFFLQSPSLAELDRAVATLLDMHPLPAGFEIRYEQFEPYREGGEAREELFRTYLVSKEPWLWNEHVASAQVDHSTYNLMPEVRVVLTDEGARRFGDATAAGVGEKLAILLDGDVTSAPIIQSPARGGEVSITMGGNDPERMQRDASALAGALGSWLPLPPGFEARLVAANAPGVGIACGLRLVAAVLGGVLALGLATLF
jgi:preprotein translocase subunit SecD